MKEAAPKKPRVRIRRVDQKLQALLRTNADPKKLTAQVSGTSEETAALFSSGTVPAVKMTMETH